MSEALELGVLLDSALDAAYDKIEAPDDDAPAVVDTHDESPPDAEPETAELSAHEEPEAPIESAVPAKEAPATWRAEAKAIFSTLPPAAQEEILKREADAARGIQQHAEKARGYDEFAKVITPYQQMIEAEGGTPATAVASLLETAALLRMGTPEQKAALISDLCTRYGVRLDGQAPTPVDHQLQGLHQTISQLQGRLAHYETLQQQSVDEWTSKQIDTFAASKDDKGAPLYPHFDTLRTQMGKLIAAGEASTLEDAYEKASNLHPEILQAKIEAAAAKKAEEQLKAAEAARKAASQRPRVRGVHTAANGQAGSIDDTMSQTYDRLHSAA